MSFFQKFYGWEGGVFLLYLLNYSETYPYLLSLLHPSVQAYHIINNSGIRKQYWSVFGQTNQSDLYQVLHSQNSIKTFLKKNHENEKI